MASRSEICCFRFYMPQNPQIHVHCVEDSDRLRLPKGPNSGLILLFLQEFCFLLYNLCWEEKSFLIFWRKLVRLSGKQFYMFTESVLTAVKDKMFSVFVQILNIF